jgi:hypothetical protein
MGVLYTHSPKSPGPFTKLPKKKFKKIQKIQKKRFVSPMSRCQPRPAGDCWSLAGHGGTTWIGGKQSLFFLISFSLALRYLCKWSTLVSWLQHMPTMARPCPKTSNTHNFWTVAPKIMKFALTRSLRRDASSQKVSKNLKIAWGQATLTKTGLVTPGTYGPLRVNPLRSNHWRI